MDAIKFTDEGGYVKVSYETTQDKVLISMKDNGKGIPKQFIEKMFEKFHQVEASTNKVHEGTGLGLAIVKGLLDEHGGQIWAESEVEAGSQFTFTLPWNGVDIKSTNQKLAA